MLQVKFLRGKNNQVCKGKDLIIQTKDAHLIGCCTTYSNIHTWDEVHDNLINHQGMEDWRLAKADGYRFFVTLLDSLDNMTYEHLANHEFQKYVKETLNQMAEFMITQFPESMLRGLQEK